MPAQKTVGPLAPERLRCEYLTNPLGLDELRPRLSWQVAASRDDAGNPRRGARQAAYRILVASSADLLGGDKADAWDSGKVASDRSIHVVYEGPALRSRQRCFWKVCTWDTQDHASPWSAVNWWEMGLLDPKEWRGAWIGLAREASADSPPCPFLRRSFRTTSRIARARAYVTARGLYELHVNGKRVGADRLTPGWTDYGKRIAYQVYDVTELLRQGENALGAILGDGWYCGYVAGKGRNAYGTELALLVQVVIEYEGGRSEVIASDENWRASTGPILKSDIYNGETYDARLEMPGWAEPGFDDGGWAKPRVFEPTAAALVAKRSQPVRAISEIQPIAMTEPLAGAYVFDMGQNMVGLIRLRVQGPAGTKITIRYAEMLNPDGTLYTTNLTSAKATDEYVLKGGGGETYEPHFTFHGFQYVELSGCPQRPTVDAITGIVLHADTPPTGTFECSEPLVNRLQHNIVWGQKGNFLEVPTDCPQRAERLGWMGDAQAFIRTACFNMDVAAFFTKWMVDVEDGQADDGAFPDVAPNVLPGKGVAGWADAGVICPWTVYLCYGDTRILEQHYDSMARWVDYMRRTSTGLIRPDFGYGDWLAPDVMNPGNAPTPKDLIGTAYFAYCARLMSNVARILGKTTDAEQFAALADDVKAAFNREFVTSTGRLVGHTQTGYVLALAFDLLPDEKRPVAVRHLVADIEKRNWHLATGFIGAILLAPTLSRFGRTDVAYKLLRQETYPSWLYPVKHGATTIWERWDGWTEERGFQDPGMNSFNHYAYGAVGRWMYATVAGIDLDPGEPAYKHVLFRPEPGGGLTHARGELLTMYGRVASAWKLEGDRFTLDVTVPANARGTVVLPASDLRMVTESAKPLGETEGVSRARIEDGKVCCEISSGLYAFAVRK